MQIGSDKLAQATTAIPFIRNLTRHDDSRNT